MKYSREYEKQADLLGAQIMARAGYDPRDLGRMFETIQKQGGSGAPQWMSSHPDPGNRSAYIAREASLLQIAASSTRTDEFQQARATFGRLPPAKSIADLARGGPANTSGPEGTVAVGRVGDPVPDPSAQFRRVQGGRLFDVEIPSNWQPVSSNSAIKYVPPNGYGPVDSKQGRQTVFTHGVELGVARAGSRDLADATDTLLNAFARSNPDLRRTGDARQIRISQRNGLAVPLANRSYSGDSERIGVYTTFLADGNLFYFATIVPEDDADRYRAVFDRIGRSIRLKDAQ
jgi:hypothetical protein